MILLAFPQIFHFSKKKEADVGSTDNPLIILLEKIKSGDEVLREKFILDHRPFILRHRSLPDIHQHSSGWSHRLYNNNKLLVDISITPIRTAELYIARRQVADYPETG